MEFMYFLFMMLLPMFWFDVEAQSSCQDLDSAACVAMAKQNTGLCTDQVLAKTACPAYCKLCPVTCYNCNLATSDVKQCNTITCANGETCLLKSSRIGTTNMYRMQCGPKTTCSNGRKRDVKYSSGVDIQSRDTMNNVICCDSDLCNSPASIITTLPPSTMTTTTTPATTSKTPNIYNSCKRDVIIMIDKSRPMVPFTVEIKSVITDVISHLDIGTDNMRIAVGTFGKYASKQWNLDRYVDKASLLAAVNSIYIGTLAATGNNLAALQLVLNSFNQGNRPSVPDDVIFISEGHSFHYFSQNKEDAAIRALHQKSNDVISVAMGGANQNEMHQIASDNSHFIYISSYDQFIRHNVVSKLLNLLCKV